MSSAGFLIEEPFGIKQDALVESYTFILQDILTSKQERWCQSSGDNFFTSHPNTKWSSEESNKIQSGDIRQWDTTLLAKWLIEFRWEPHETKLDKAEQDAIDKLRRLRNSTKHRAKNSHLSEEEFIKNCEMIQTSLLLLGIGQDTITKIIIQAKRAAIVDRYNLQEQFSRLAETPWKFTTQEILGSGSFGIVISAIYELDQVLYAIKIIPYRKSYCDLAAFEDYVSREARNLAKLDHINVVQYKTSQMFKFTPDKLSGILQWHTNRDKKDKICSAAQEFFSASFHDAISSNNMISGLYIQTEVCGETLRDWLKKNIYDKKNLFDRSNDNKKDQIRKDIVSGVGYIHKEGIIHRDLRPDNIYFARGGFRFPIKIGDFGLSNQTKIDELVTMTKAVGNQLYRAPEINQPSPNNSEKAKYSQAADLYSLGLIISEVYSPSSDLLEKFSLITYNRNTGVIINDNYPRINVMILQLTDKDPSKRLIRSHSYTELFESFHDINIAGPSTSAQGLHQSRPPSNDQVDNAIGRFVPPGTSSDQEAPDIPPLTLTRNHTFGTQNVNVATSSSYNFPQPNNSRGQNDVAPAPPDQNDSREFLKYSEIFTLRKMLQRDREFWTPPNIARFFSSIENTNRLSRSFEDSTKTKFNSNLYRIHKDQPNLLTKNKIKNAVIFAGFPLLGEQIEQLGFEI